MFTPNGGASSSQYLSQYAQNSATTTNVTSNSNDYLKNLISTVYALTNYQQQQQLHNLQQQQQQQQQQQGSANSTRLLINHYETNDKSVCMDVNAKVEEHFKRSLGAHNFNTLFKKTKHSVGKIVKKSANKAVKQSSVRAKVSNATPRISKKFSHIQRPVPSSSVPAVRLR